MHAAFGVVHSRSGADLAARFPTVLEAVAMLGDVVLDGELVTERGTVSTSLHSPSARRGRKGIAARFYVSTCSSTDGGDVRDQSYSRCRARLEALSGAAP